MDPWLEDPAIFPDLPPKVRSPACESNQRVIACALLRKSRQSGVVCGNDDPMSECFLEVYAKPYNKELVAAVEVLSLADKPDRTPAGPCI